MGVTSKNSHLRLVPVVSTQADVDQPGTETRAGRLGPDDMELSPQMRDRLDAVRAQLAGKTMTERRRELLTMRFGKDGTIYTGPRPVADPEAQDTPPGGEQ